MASGFAANTDLSTLDGANGFRLDGVAAFDNSGLSVMSMDINGDGVTDVIIGAPGTDIHGPLSGSVYVVFGHAPTAAVTRFGSHAGQDMSGGAFEDTLLGLVGSDTLEGRGNGDGLIGGPGDDTASYAHASAGVVANLAEPGLNSGAAAGDAYDSIESITGSRFADTLVGDSYSNTLSGLSGGDSLDGDRGSDRLIGGRGADTLKGGPGRDTFVLVATADSPKGRGRDKIVDFDAGTAASVVDRIDLHKIDARTNIPGNQAFTFIGTAAFTRVSGQLRAQQSGSTTIISGDVNGDAVADFEIALVPFTNLAGIGRREFIP
jgi:Ca2+-binding RTX toxin-like protein